MLLWSIALISSIPSNNTTWSSLDPHISFGLLSPARAHVPYCCHEFAETLGMPVHEGLHVHSCAKERAIHESVANSM